MGAIGDAIRAASDFLAEHPEEAAYTDSAAVATLESGLGVSVVDPSGRSLRTDMPAGVGGEDSAPSPGWLFRAAVAACDATLIAMRAEMLGISLSSVEVTVDSESNDYGILGLDASIPAGPLSMRARVKLSSPDADEGMLDEVVDWAAAHCPVHDAVRRAVPVTLEIVG